MFNIFKQKPFEAVIDTPGEIGKLDPYSPTWVYVREWSKDMLDKTRQRNDSTSLSIEQTMVLRGKIRVLKEILALPKAGKGILNNITEPGNRLKRPTV